MIAGPRARGDLAELDTYHSPQLDVAVRLNTNESPVPPPDTWRTELAAEMAEMDWHRYPDRAASSLRDAIAGHHGVSVDQVLAANGSNEVIQALCLAYAGRGRAVAVFEPTYALHRHIAKITGSEVATGERATDFSLDLREVRRVIESSRPALVFLCSPNNPTGLVDEPDDVAALLDTAAASGSLVVADEAYGQFAAWSATTLLDEETPLVVTRTFSKTWAMAAARLGYVLGPTRVIEQLEAVVLPYHLDTVTQIAGRLALGHVEEMESRVAAIVEERGRLQAALADLPVDQWPSGANFVLFRPRSRDGRDVWQALVDRSVLVRDCSSWPRLGGCLRVTIGTRQDDDRFLETLAEALA